MNRVSHVTQQDEEADDMYYPGILWGILAIVAVIVLTICGILP
ncbi:MAG: hypothetical protein ACUVX9_13325 [Anaerolineae bacterium]